MSGRRMGTGRRRGIVLPLVVSAAAALAGIGTTGAGASDEAFEGDGSSFRVGAAVVDISPSVLLGPDRVGEVCLGGYGTGCSRPAEGEREPLYARALVVESNGDKIALATSTNVGLFAAYKPELGEVGTYDIRRAAARVTGIPSTSIVITSDHSHAAPDVNGIWGGVPREYLEKHASAVARAIVLADLALEPAEIHVGEIETDTRLSGHWLDKESPFHALDGSPLDQVDRTVHVLQARRPHDASVIVTMINFAPHATILGSGNRLASGDWAGVVGNEAAERLGGVGIGMVGTLGGMSHGRRGEEDMVEFVDLLLDLSAEALSGDSRVTVDGVGAVQTFIREPLTAPLLYAGMVPYTRHLYDAVDITIDRAFSPPWATGNLVGTTVTTMRIGDVIVGGAPGEAYPEHSLALMRLVPEARAHFLLGLANDQLGYLIAPLAGVPQAAENGGLYPLQGNDNFGLSVSPTIGEHVICTMLDQVRALGFAAGEYTQRCVALTALDGLLPPEEIP